MTDGPLGVDDGRDGRRSNPLTASSQACADWAVPATQPPLSAGLLCRPCLLTGRVRRAWTVTAGDATCIRHTVEATDLDDMDQHHLFADLYEQLRHLGAPDAY